jgi:phosphotransferase system HPr (HPr) family protein
MRPATAFALLASKFQSEVRVFNEDRSANGKSVLELFTLVALPGAELIIEASGPDAGDALAALAEVINRPVEEPAEPPPSAGL